MSLNPILHCWYYINIWFSASEDYEAIASSIITFSPEQTSATVSVTIVDDDVLEDVEQFTVEVVATEGQERVDVVGDAANIFISDDDCENFFKCFASFICPACLPACLPACVPVLLSLHMYMYADVYLSISICLCVSLSSSPYYFVSFTLIAVTVGFSSATYSVSEGDGISNVSLELTGTTEREVTVLIKTGNGTATGSLSGWWW